MTNIPSYKPEITTMPYGTMPDGTKIFEYTLVNSRGMTMKVINYGGIITHLTAPDRNNNFEDVVLGCNSLDEYRKGNSYFGAIIGRYGNRIAHGKFVLDGHLYALKKNNGPHTLHGGAEGFDRRIWNIAEHQVNNGVSLKLTYFSKDMEEGFPGNLQAEVIYHLTDKNELKIDYRATTDKKTIINLTQHTYFNLSGNTNNNILLHTLTINADQFVPVDKTLIPTGGLADVSKTPFDFRSPATLGLRINHDHLQLRVADGYDHCWVLNGAPNTLERAATVYEPTTGRLMDVHTTEPGIQFYSGNFLDGSVTGKYGVVYHKRYGFCLETEHFPDSPNQSGFPSVVLTPGEVYTSQTVYSFTVK